VNYNPLSNSLIDIFDGRTAFDLNGQRLFFRHFTIRDQNSIASSYEKYKQIAIKKGIETEEQIYKRLKDDGDWSNDDDLKIAELETYVKNLKNTKEKLFLPSQKENHQKLIDEQQSELSLLLFRKSELVRTSAEGYANKMANEEFLRTLIYEDSNLNKLKYSDEDFGSLTSDDIAELSKAYFRISSDLSDLNIQNIVLQDFFNIYLSACENPYHFFGKFIHQLTAYQMKLLLYGRIFNNIFQYHDDIPDDIKKDPQAIFDFVDSKKNRENFQSQNKDGATAIFGATSSDLEILDPSARKVSLSEEIKKSGGSLNMEQMMKLMGQ
jgi:hypothetical protein